MKMTRKIINIDEDVCDGCGLCIPSCHERAIQLVETPNGKKARLVKEIYRDGLGACLGTCPTGALTIEEREGRLWTRKRRSAILLENAHAESTGNKKTQEVPVFQESELWQWPVQLHLVPPNAPYFHHANLVMAADCVPFAYANFHQEFLKGDENAIAVGCLKLDDTHAYLEKLTQIIRLNHSLKHSYREHGSPPAILGLSAWCSRPLTRPGLTFRSRSRRSASKAIN